MKEREVKLGAGNEFQLPDLEGVREGVSASVRPEQQLTTLYLDSDEHHLARWGLSFRHRAGQGWTVKLPGDSSGALLVRDEITYEGDAETPPPPALDLVKGYVRRRELSPQVHLRTLRRGILLHDQHGQLVADVVEDAVNVLDGPCAGQSFRELEVETTEGTPEGLLETIVSRLRDAGAGPPDPTPKYLRAIGGPTAAPAEVVLAPLPKSASAGDVVTHAIADGVTRLLRHDPVVRLDTDVEGVHQARVATRRLRSDLRTFRRLLDREWVAALRAELGWLGAQFGEARDADVLLERLTRRAGQLPEASQAGTRGVIEALAQRRVQAHADLLATLRSDRYLDLVEQLVAAARAPALREAKSSQRAAQALPRIVRHAWTPLEKHVRSLGDPVSDEDLHMIRILGKRCRYAAEACAPSLGKRTHKLALAARELQDVLGELNDAVVAEQWLRGWTADVHAGSSAFAAGELAALERVAADQARSQWPRAWKHVKRAAPGD